MPGAGGVFSFHFSEEKKAWMEALCRISSHFLCTFFGFPGQQRDNHGNSRKQQGSAQTEVS